MMRTKAGFSYYLIATAIIVFVAILIYSLLTPVAHWMLDYSLAMSSSEYSTEGINSIETMWDYWPVWFSIITLVSLYIRAVRESMRGEV